jgi:hypothetical protein
MAMRAVFLPLARREGLIQVFGADPLAPMYENAVAAGFALLSVDAGHDAMVVAPQQVADALVASLTATPQ